MKKTFWLEPRRLAGRPGPDREPWDLAELAAGGIGAVLSVNDGALCRREEFDAAGITYACVPFPDSAPPRPGDEEACVAALVEAQSFIDAQLARGRAVLVHCSSGKDRTGMVMAYYLMRRDGLEPREAIAAVRRVRPVALSAAGWEALGLSVLAQMRQAPAAAS